MKMVLDTNVLSELMNPRGSQIVKSWVSEQPRVNLFTTSINQAEILGGIAIMPEGKRSQALQEIAQAMFAEDFAGQVLSFDSEAAICFAQITSNRRKSGNPISQADALIASVCLANNAAIITRNVNDFLDCQITIINPWNL